MARSGKKQQLAQWLEERAPARIGAEQWRALREHLAPVADSYLRRLLRESGAVVEQPWAGVRQRDFDELEASLIELGETYRDPVLAPPCRRAVIEAKDHARLAARGDKRETKLEMVEWMLVWLADPAMFPAWARARKASGSFPPAPPLPPPL